MTHEGSLLSAASSRPDIFPVAPSKRNSQMPLLLVLLV